MLGALCKGNWDIVSRDREDATWIVNDLVDNGSPRFFLYSRATKTATLLFLARPELEGPLARAGLATRFTRQPEAPVPARRRQDRDLRPPSLACVR